MQAPSITSSGVYFAATSRGLVTQQKSLQRALRLVHLYCNLLWTILLSRHHPSQQQVLLSHAHTTPTQSPQSIVTTFFLASISFRLASSIATASLRTASLLRMVPLRCNSRILGSGSFPARINHRTGWTLAATQSSPSSSSSSSRPDMILVNCGDKGKSIDDNDRAWTGDDGSKFLPSSNNNTVATKANPKSQGSVPSVPFSTARIFPSAFTYSIPVQGDRYFLRLYFYRGDYGDLFKSDAVFDVFCGRYTLLKKFNTSHYAKALNQEYFVREYSINTTSLSTHRWINLTFTPSNVSETYAFVNGIELVPMPNIFTAKEDPTLIGTGKPYHINSSEALGTMYRLNVGGSTLQLSEDSGKLYRQWSEDANFVADAALGKPLKKMDNVTIKYIKSDLQYIAPRDVYGTARSTPWHNDSKLSWILAVDPGFYYLVRLHFCEIRYPFTLKKQRVFTIYVNKHAAASDFDIISRSGGIGIPIYYDSVTAFSGGDRQVDLQVCLHPDTQSKSHYMNVILNGLEVFKLGRFNGNLEDLMQTPPPRNQTKGEKEIGGVVGGIVGSIGALFLAGLIGYVIYRCWHRPSGGHVPVHQPPLFPAAGSKISLWTNTNSCCKFTFEQMKEATNDFSEKLLLGVGGFGKVYRGNIDGERTKVAIKRANPMSEQGIREFRTEIELLPKLRHKHLVSLIGFCNENFEMILVYDYMAHGSFREHLYGTQKPPLTWKQRLEICIGAARGLHYLHTGSKHAIIHRDVKTTNILLDGDWVAKLSDFGLSKTGPSLDKAHVSTVVKGSFGYLDPEYFECRQLTKKSDVYSFGVVLFEAMCARPAITQDLQMEPVSLARWATDCMKKGLLDEIIDPHIKGEIAPQSLKTCVEAAEMCIAHSGRDRPTMADVLSNLELALQQQESKKSSNNINGRREETCIPISAPRTPASDGSTTIRASRTKTLEDQSLSLSMTSDLLTPSAIFSEMVHQNRH